MGVVALDDECFSMSFYLLEDLGDKTLLEVFIISKFDTKWYL